MLKGYRSLRIPTVIQTRRLYAGQVLAEGLYTRHGIKLLPPGV